MYMHIYIYVVQIVSRKLSLTVFVTTTHLLLLGVCSSEKKFSFPRFF